MTVATLPFWFNWFRKAPAEAADLRTDPPVPHGSGPVFIHDAVTPWRGETLLSAKLKADIERALDDPP